MHRGDLREFRRNLGVPNVRLGMYTYSLRTPDPTRALDRRKHQALNHKTPYAPTATLRNKTQPGQFDSSRCFAGAEAYRKERASMTPLSRELLCQWSRRGSLTANCKTGATKTLNPWNHHALNLGACTMQSSLQRLHLERKPERKPQGPKLAALAVCNRVQLEKRSAQRSR